MLASAAGSPEKGHRRFDGKFEPGSSLAQPWGSRGGSRGWSFATVVRDLQPVDGRLGEPGYCGILASAGASGATVFWKGFTGSNCMTRLQEQSSKTLQAPAFTGSITSGATTLCVLFALPKVQANQALLMQRLQMLRASSPPNTSGVQVGPAAVVRFQVKAQGSEDLTAGLGYQQQ